MAVAWTQAELDALKALYVKGVRSVSHGGKTVTYASMAEMAEAIDRIEKDLRSESNRPLIHRAKFGGFG